MATAPSAPISAGADAATRARAATSVRDSAGQDTCGSSVSKMIRADEGMRQNPGDLSPSKTARAWPHEKPRRTSLLAGLNPVASLHLLSRSCREGVRKNLQTPNREGHEVTRRKTERLHRSSQRRELEG